MSRTVSPINLIMTIIMFDAPFDDAINHRFAQFICRYLTTTYVYDKQGFLLSSLKGKGYRI